MLRYIVTTDYSGGDGGVSLVEDDRGRGSLIEGDQGGSLIEGDQG